MIAKDEPEIEDIPSKYTMKAKKILTKGDPIKYIIDTWQRNHVGDKQIGLTCCMATVTTMLSNTSGLHIKPSGKSGKGKSDAIISFLHLIPEEKKLIGSLSGKSLFYNKELKSGTLIFSDDVKLNEDIITTIKQTTTFYQNPYLHRTVTKNLTPITLSVPARLCWILTSVNGFDDDQMGNRFISTDVDESNQQDELVYQKQIIAERTGLRSDSVDENVLISRAIFQILDKELSHVSIPFIDSIHWGNKDNRRNFPMFLDIIKAVTIFNKFQRIKYKKSYLADINDYNFAKMVYNIIETTNATNLSMQGLKLINFLKTNGASDISKIQDHLHAARTTVEYLLNGREKGIGGGLLSQVPGLKTDKYPEIFEKTDNNGHFYSIKTVPKRFYWYDGPPDEKAYTDIVSLDIDTLTQSHKQFMQEFKGVPDKGD